MNYKEILENVLKNGQPKQAVRFDSSGNHITVENSTIGTFCEIFRHDMSQGFPLTTLRKMPYKSMAIELEGFIKGITDKKWYQDRKCKFWDEWANPVAIDNKINSSIISEASLGWKEQYRKVYQKEENDLGPIYGFQWVNFDGHYKQAHLNSLNNNFHHNPNGVKNGFNQLKSIVDKLKTNPYDRRMVCSAWNPNQIYLMALPPCHYAFTVVVYGDKLNLCWKQRSVDSVLGLPNNIASYALLQTLLCIESGLYAGELVGILEDCHIYENQLEAVKELIKRDEKELPTMKISWPDDKEFSIFDWKYTDIILENYNPHPKVDMGAVTV